MRLVLLGTLASTALAYLPIKMTYDPCPWYGKKSCKTIVPYGKDEPDCYWLIEKADGVKTQRCVKKSCSAFSKKGLCKKVMGDGACVWKFKKCHKAGACTLHNKSKVCTEAGCYWNKDDSYDGLYKKCLMRPPWLDTTVVTPTALPTDSSFIRYNDYGRTHWMGSHKVGHFKVANDWEIEFVLRIYTSGNHKVYRNIIHFGSSKDVMLPSISFNKKSQHDLHLATGCTGNVKSLVIKGEDLETIDRYGWRPKVKVSAIGDEIIFTWNDEEIVRAPRGVCETGNWHDVYYGAPWTESADVALSGVTYKSLDVSI